jgi:flagellar FliL protein
MAATENPGTEIGSLVEKKGPNLLLIIAGILVFLLVVAVGGFVGYTKLPKAVAGMTGETILEKKVVRLETKAVIALEPFLVNLADADYDRFLKAEFRLGMTEVLKVPLESDSVEITTIRDAIVRLLSSKTSDEIMTNEGKEILCEEMRLLVNERIPKNRVAKVFIVDFLIQF